MPQEKDFMEKPTNYKDLPTAMQIILECEEIKDLLLTKNAAYGDAVHAPGELFDIDPVIAIKARINDKVKRILNKGINSDTEDTLQDLIGYLIHLRIAIKKKTPEN